MHSKITGGSTTFIFKAKLLSKYDVSYYRCDETGFIQTEEPHWMEEAYSNAITKLDVGLVQRNLDLAELSYPLIMKYFDHDKRFLDYAGGYGLFTRLMRYKGIDFYNSDPYCENVFAEYYDLKNLPASSRFELVTAFEVFEHLPQPLAGIEAILQYSENLLFSTVIVPKDVNLDWWYYSFETGQHVSFYTIESLEYIAAKFNRHLYTNGKTVHLFTKKRLPSDPFKSSTGAYLVKKMIKKLRKLEASIYGKKENLMENDTQEAKKRISS